mmetsp:Transcript_1607/g.2473  ORF Transcript_1607/g.2473 Transcript_1607/m.2473 type:complete len:94 (+) Transcript_1607:467-748(+)
MNIKTGRRLSVAPVTRDDEDTEDARPPSETRCSSTEQPTALASRDRSGEAGSGGPTTNEKILLGASEARQLRDRVRQLEEFIAANGLTSPPPL